MACIEGATVHFRILGERRISYSYVIGGFTNYTMVSCLSAVGPVILGISLIFMPDSPLFLLERGKEEEARKSLYFFRRCDDAGLDVEMKEFKQLLDEAKERHGTLKDMLANKASRKGIITSLGLMFCQQLSGINGVMFYASEIFDDISDNLEARYLTMIAGAVQVLGTLFATFLVDQLGRRVLLIASFAGMAVSLTVVAILSGLELKGNITWISPISIYVYLVLFSLGAGPLPWAMVGELFLTEYKPIAGSLCGCTNWLMAFVVSMSFPSIQKAFGLSVCLGGYAVLCVISTIFIMFFVIETKDKTLEEVLELLANK